MKRKQSRRGQATVEYALVTHFLLIGGGLLLMPILADFFNSLSLFFESLYFVLNTGAI